MIWNWALWSNLAQAACPTPWDAAALVSALDGAKEAYADLEVEAFRQAMTGVHERLPCLDEEVSRHLAAELHRFEGLLGFLERDPDRSQRAFASARAIEPNYKFPLSLVPEGNPVLAQYVALDPNSGPSSGATDTGESVRIADPLQGNILLDGAPTRLRSTVFPLLFQRTDAEGNVVETVYLWPGDALPAYPARTTPALTDGTGPTGGNPNLVGAVRAGPNKKLLVGAGVTALVSGLCYGGAFVVNSRYYDNNTDVGRLDGLRRVNNGFVVASGATLAAALGLGTGALLTGTF